MTARSVWRWRDYEIRSARGELVEGGILELTLKAPFSAEVQLREVGSDPATFIEVVKEKVYANVLGHVQRCEHIIDLGANIGLASLYFLGCYPTSRLLAVEPNPSSYQMLTSNLHNLTKLGRCRTLQAAVWSSEQALAADLNRSKDHYSVFAACETSDAGSVKDPIMGLPMPRIISHSGFDTVDILKVDIEGAETGLFGGDVSWLRQVGAIAIEFHDASRKDSNFDGIMEEYGFDIYDQDPHTVLAINRTKPRGSNPRG
jgi:FkbM family methyltransferase